MKIVYCTPALYMAGGVERVLTLKANYFADVYGYDVTIILTEGKDLAPFYPLSDKVTVINLGIGFEELWTCSFVKKILVYIRKQRLFKKLLRRELMRMRPDVTVSLLRREINFINSIPDGSKKIGELHINRAHYRNFEGRDSNLFKNVFARLWMANLVGKLQRLDRLVVLTEKDKEAWTELNNVEVIPDPLSLTPQSVSSLTEKRVIAVGRYCHEKGYDHLLKAWSRVEKACPEWRLEFFGDGDKTPYLKLLDELEIDRSRCLLNGRTSDIEKEYLHSSIFVLSSRFEGFGMVLVEAMACGLPVVSFDCPWGPRSIITDGDDGLLVENGNIEQLAAKLQYLVSNADLQKQLAASAVKSVSRYKIDRIAGKWKDLFDSL